METGSKLRSPWEIFEDSILSGFESPDNTALQARADLNFFIEEVMVDQRGKPLKLQPFHKEFTHRLLFERRVLALLPRAFGKSTIGSVAYPCWRLGTNRDLRIIIASNTITQAKWWLSEIENVMRNNLNYHKIFGFLVPKPRALRWTDTEKVVLGRSSYAMHSSLLACGVGSALLGARSDIIIADDIFGEKESMSPALQRAVSVWLWKVLLNTLEPDGQVVVQGSRWGRNDIYKEIMQRWFPRDYQREEKRFAAWLKGDIIAPADYPSQAELIALEKQGQLDPLEERVL